MSQLKQALYGRLAKSGIDRCLVPGFLRNLANAHRADVSLNHSQAQAQLRYLGWNDIELDYHTWQLAEAYLTSGPDDYV